MFYILGVAIFLGGVLISQLFLQAPPVYICGCDDEGDYDVDETDGNN